MKNQEQSILTLGSTDPAVPSFYLATSGKNISNVGNIKNMRLEIGNFQVIGNFNKKNVRNNLDNSNSETFKALCSIYVKITF